MLVVSFVVLSGRSASYTVSPVGHLVWLYNVQVPDDPGIADRQPVEKVHQHHHDQEDKTE